MSSNDDLPIEAANLTLDWGRTSYHEAWKRQEEWVAERIEGKRPDTLIFTEHNPVYTIGMRSGSDTHLVWGEDRLAAEGIEVVRTNRGGDITYHGPGQVVGYPIISLEARRDLHAYLRFLEEVMIRSVAHFGLSATRREGKTGIWLGNRKIAAIGVAVRRWVTFHGFALNVRTELRHFTGIVPCGISAQEGAVTSLQAELGQAPELAEVRRVLALEFWSLHPSFLAANELSPADKPAGSAR